MSTDQPALMEHLVQLEAKLDTLADEARRHWSRDEERMRLVDQFVDPQLSLDSLLKQIFEQLRNQKAALEQVERALRDEHRTTRSAVALYLGDPGRSEREAGQHRTG